MHYPRNFTGYGKNTPNPSWPKNKNIAIQFVVNYEEGGENCVLHGDPSSEAFLSEIVGASPWLNQRHWNMESIYEYGARVGFWRLYRLFTDANIPVTVFGVATALARAPEQVGAMKEADWEIASHGLKWIDYKDITITTEKYHFKEALKIHEAVVGVAPSGWYLGRCSENSVKIATEFGKFDYISDAYDDELPYWYTYKNKNQLIIPYTLDVNDMRFATPQVFNSGTQFYDYLKDTFDFLLSEGRKGTPKMMTIGLHCRLIGRPGRALSIQRFLDYIQSYPDVWLAKRIEIADHWKKFHPAVKNTIIPFNLAKKQFLDTFGNVFENSTWIAERTFDHEISPALNTTIGLHAALCFQFRISSDEEKRCILRAHPDLAGKLSQANMLTPESRKEQNSAGLDNLTAQELKDLTELNERYTSKFKHPFIMAVTGSSKAEIIKNFSRRIENDSKTEMKIACEQVEKIALTRIKEILEN